MGKKSQRVWDLFMDLTGLDPIELQKEMNPIIKKLKIDLDNVEMSDIRRIMAHYLRHSLGKRLKTVEDREEFPQSRAYTRN